MRQLFPELWEGNYVCVRDNNDQIYCDVWPVAVTDCTFHLKCRSYSTKCTGKWRRKQQLLQEVKKFPAQHCVESFHHRAWTKTKIWHKSAHNTDNHVVESVCRYGYCHKFNVLSNGITKKKYFVCCCNLIRSNLFKKYLLFRCFFLLAC